MLESYKHNCIYVHVALRKESFYNFYTSMRTSWCKKRLYADRYILRLPKDETEVQVLFLF